MFATFFDALPKILALSFLALGLWGFWRGLAMRPHERENRPAPLSKYFWWAND